MDEKPKLRTGSATMRKKVTDKYVTTEVTEKDVTKVIYLETIELYGQRWNRFEDKRGWTWVQQELQSEPTVSSS